MNKAKILIQELKRRSENEKLTKNKVRDEIPKIVKEKKWLIEASRIDDDFFILFDDNSLLIISAKAWTINVTTLDTFFADTVDNIVKELGNVKS